MKVSKEETFGPLAPLFRFKTEDEAVAWQMIRNLVWPHMCLLQSAARQWRVGEALEYGMVELTQEQFQMKLRHLVELNNQA
jgi:succinate-semialdehyde dehydrogenase/glutarate-semialdehyde dehydrogenase